MIFPGQAEVGAQVYICMRVCVFVWLEKKEAGGGDAWAIWRHSLTSLQIRHLALFV